MIPIRSEILCRRVSVCSLWFFFFSALLYGCAWLSPKQDKDAFVLNDADARRAGALALYSKGLMLEGDEQKSTNTNAVAKEASVLAFRQALQLEPDNRKALAALVSSLTERERYKEALQVLEGYLDRHPDDLEMRLEAARAAEAANEPDRAASHCAAILALQPDNRELAQALVRLYFQSDQTTRALRLCRDLYARFHDRESASLPVQWAVYFSSEGRQPERAMDCLRLALTQRTNSAERAALISLMAEDQMLLGQTNAAETSLLRAFRENPSSTTPILRLGTLWSRRADATNTLARRAKGRGEKAETAQLMLAATQQALDNNTAAIITLREFIDKRRSENRTPGESYYLWLCSLVEDQKKTGETVPLLREALALYPASHELKNFLAYLWAEQGSHLEEANRLVNEALAAEPKNAAYLDTKGWILFKSGRAYDALQFLLKAADTDKDEPEILDHAGDVLNAIGRESEAIIFWKRSLQLDPQPAVAEKLKKHGATTQPKKP